MPTEIASLPPAEAIRQAEMLENWPARCNPLLKYSARMTAAYVLRKFAKGELRKVVHGQWHENLKHKDGRVNRDCSVCHGRTNDYTPTPICPWCGALMNADGGDSNDVSIT